MTNEKVDLDKLDELHKRYRYISDAEKSAAFLENYPAMRDEILRLRASDKQNAKVFAGLYKQGRTKDRQIAELKAEITSLEITLEDEMYHRDSMYED